ncbi:hypothetical protein EMIT0P100_70143 [Pseudomonas sp. IT-P100]
MYSSIGVEFSVSACCGRSAKLHVTLSTKTQAVRSGTSRLRLFTTGYLGNCIDLSFPLAFNLSSHLYRIGAIGEPLTNYEFLHNCA